MQLPPPGQLTLFFKEHWSNPHFACSWDSPNYYIVRALPGNKLPFQYTYFTSNHPPWINRGFIKGEAMRLLWTISSKSTREESEGCLANFKQRLEAGRYPTQYIERRLYQVKTIALNKRKRICSDVHVSTKFGLAISFLLDIKCH